MRESDLSVDSIGTWSIYATASTVCRLCKQAILLSSFHLLTQNWCMVEYTMAHGSDIHSICPPHGPHRSVRNWQTTLHLAECNACPHMTHQPAEVCSHDVPAPAINPLRHLETSLRSCAALPCSYSALTCCKFKSV